MFIFAGSRGQKMEQFDASCAVRSLAQHPAAARTSGHRCYVSHCAVTSNRHLQVPTTSYDAAVKERWRVRGRPLVGAPAATPAAAPAAAALSAHWSASSQYACAARISSALWCMDAASAAVRVEVEGA